MDLAAQSQSIEAVAEDLDLVSMLLEQTPTSRRFSVPRTSASRPSTTWSKDPDSRLQRLTLNFLFVMIDHNRGRFLPKIIGRYRQLYRVYQGYQTVDVTVAQP